MGFFTLSKHCLVNKYPEKYKIEPKLNEAKEFSLSLDFENNFLSQEDKNIISIEFDAMIKSNYKESLYRYVPIPEYVFLYLCKFGTEAVKHCFNNKS